MPQHVASVNGFFLSQNEYEYQASTQRSTALLFHIYYIRSTRFRFESFRAFGSRKIDYPLSVPTSYTKTMATLRRTTQDPTVSPSNVSRPLSALVVAGYFAEFPHRFREVPLAAANNDLGIAVAIEDNFKDRWKCSSPEATSADGAGSTESVATSNNGTLSSSVSSCTFPRISELLKVDKRTRVTSVSSTGSTESQIWASIDETYCRRRLGGDIHTMRQNKFEYELISLAESLGCDTKDLLHSQVRRRENEGVITPEGLVIMAKHVADKADLASADGIWLINELKTIIRIRRKDSRWHQKMKPERRKRNKKHQEFVDFLQGLAELWEEAHKKAVGRS